MNQKKAKKLRRKTSKLMRDLGMSLGKGYNEYSQEKNCVSWDRFNTPDGKVAVDPDGIPLLRPTKKPGTVKHKWEYKAFYKFIKKLHKKKDEEAIKKLKEVEGE